MASQASEEVTIGRFVGRVMPGFEGVVSEERLEGLSAELREAEGKTLATGRHHVAVIPVTVDDREVAVAVKAFGRQKRWKDRYDRQHGSKAARSFRAAEFLTRHGVGTPAPVACFERWEGGRLAESFYLSRYEEGLTSFKDHLITIYQRKREWSELVSLLEHVATAVRKMHDAGFCHRDLGNQNIELKDADGDGWGEVMIIDLNRGRIREALTMQERARDFSRMRLPTAFLYVFCRAYWQDEPPADFLREMNWQRRKFDWWARSWRWRHPFRTPKPGSGLAYPRPQDIWIWDSRSAQATITMLPAERSRYYPRGRALRVAKAVATNALRVHREYGRVLETAFQEKISMAGRIGVALEAESLPLEPQIEHLSRLGRVPVLVRFCHHEGAEQWERAAAAVRQLHEAGHEVMISMVQDREAVLDPESWNRFLRFVLEQVAEHVSEVEIGHATNRTKWGVHSPQEHGALVQGMGDLARDFPELRFTGPGCIDFEFHYVLAALAETPAGFSYGALSHLLYVDRRGAPENHQGKYGTLEKCALLRAIANTSPHCADRVIISEVNWPLSGTGAWSPVAATYSVPGDPEHRLNVSEEEYACYMLRYLAITLCSGFVDRVYWWRLVAHGFGLVDEKADGGWRERVGFRMLQVFLQTIGDATFVGKKEVSPGVYALCFEKDDRELVMAWCHDGEFSGPWPFPVAEARNALGEAISMDQVGGSPVYLTLGPTS